MKSNIEKISHELYELFYQHETEQLKQFARLIADNDVFEFMVYQFAYYPEHSVHMVLLSLIDGWAAFPFKSWLGVLKALTEQDHVFAVSSCIVFLHKYLDLGVLHW